MIASIITNIVFVIACYFVGSIIHRLIPVSMKASAINLYSNVLKKIFLGLIVIITAYAIYKTKGITINAVFAIIGLLFLFAPKTAADKINLQPDSPFKKELSILLTVIIVVLAFTGTTLLCYDYFNSTTVISGISPDHYYYAYYGSKMAQFGIEGTDFPLNAAFNNAKEYRGMYHYFDMWMIALFNELPFKMSLINIYGFCFTPIVLSFCWLGLASVFNLFKSKLSVLDYILIVFFTCYIAGADLKLINGLNLLNQPKIYASVICSCIAFIYLYSNNIIKGFLSLSVIAVLNILALPVVCISGGIISLYLIYKKNKRTGIYLLTSLFVVGLSFIVFYRVFGEPGNKVMTDNFNLTVYLKEAAVYCAKMLLRLALSLSFILVLMLFFKEKISELYRLHKPLVAYCAVLISISYLITILFWNVVDIGQIRAFPGNVVIGLLTLSAIAIVSNKEMPKMKVAYAILFAFFAVTFIANIRQARVKGADASVSKSFIGEINKHVNEGDTYGYLYNTKNLTTSLWANNPNLVMNSLNYMGLINKNLNKVCLTVRLNGDSMPNGYAMLKKLILKADLKKFADQYSLANQPLANVQRDFIIKNNIRYLLTTDESVLPVELHSLVKTTIKDEKSGSCFFVLK